MAKIVYITNGMASTLNSSFELSRRLTAAGHEICYLSHRDLETSVRAQGYPFMRLTGCTEIREDLKSNLTNAGSKSSPWRAVKAVQLARAARRQSLACQEIPAKIEQIQPALLIVDIEMHYAILTMINSGIPIVLPMVWFSIFHHPDLPPMHTDLLPDQKAQIEQAWQKLFQEREQEMKKLRLNVRKLKRRMMPILYDNNDAHDLKELARVRQIEFETVTSWRHWLKPHLYPQLNVMSMNVMEMDFPHEPHPQLHYVGPMVNLNRQETRVTSQQQTAWETFRQMCQETNRQIIYCSLGTFVNPNQPFLQRLVSLFSKRTDWALVIGLGHKMDSKPFTDAGENVLAMTFAPQLDVLRSASAAITHGGITSINECVKLQVPMLACSTGHGDQNGCCVRVAYHGLGIRGNIDEETAESLETKLDRLLNDPQIRENVMAMKGIFDQYEQEQRAEQLVASLLRG